MNRQQPRFQTLLSLVSDLRDALANEGKTVPGRVNLRVGIFYSGLVGLVYLGFAFSAILPKIERVEPDGTRTTVETFSISAEDVVVLTVLWLTFWFVCPWAFLDVKDRVDDD